jgi:hypothetical protein
MGTLRRCAESTWLCGRVRSSGSSSQHRAAWSAAGHGCARLRFPFAPAAGDRVPWFDGKWVKLGVDDRKQLPGLALPARADVEPGRDGLQHRPARQLSGTYLEGHAGVRGSPAPSSRTPGKVHTGDVGRRALPSFGELLALFEGSARWPSQLTATHRASSRSVHHIRGREPTRLCEG